jgi:type IV secretory pathway component VirB8
VKVEKVEPTVDRPGNEEHYKCSVCNKFFDAEGKEISYPSIPQLEKPRNNTAVTVIIIVVAVVVVAAGAAAAVVVLKKKKIL